MELSGPQALAAPPREASTRSWGAPFELAMVCDSLRRPIAGVGRVALTLLRTLNARGHTVTPIDTAPNPEAQRFGNPVLVVAPRLPWARTALWHFDLLERLPKKAGEFLLDPTGYPHVLGHHPNLIVWVHDLNMLAPEAGSPFKRLWFRAFLGRSLAKARLVVCVSRFTRQRLLDRYRLPEDKCVVIHNALDPDMQCDPPAAANPFGERPFFLAVGAMGGRKNTLRLLEAFAGALAQGLSANLLLAGDPCRERTRILERIERPDLAGWVRVDPKPADRELRARYLAAAGLLFPSLEEGFGLPLLEAFAANIPVLTSNRSALPEVAGPAALLVDPEDPEAIARGILTLKRDSEVRKRLVTEGRKRLPLFSAEAQADRLIDHLWRLVKDAR